MNISFFKITILTISIIHQIYVGNISAQISILNKLSPAVVNDTTKINRKISIDNLNREIEYTDNLIVKTDILDFSDNEQDKLIEKIDSLSNSIIRQGNEFKEFESEKLSHVFLLSAKFNWKEYIMTLRNYQGDLQGMIRNIQDHQSYYVRNRSRWESSLPELDKNLTDQIRSHIQSNLIKVDEIIAEYDMVIRKLVSAENTIIQNIIFADGILREISNLQKKRKAELFTQNDKNIFAIDYKNSYSGSFGGQIKLAISESTRTFEYFYSGVKRHLSAYLTFVLFLISVLLFIRKKYIKLNYNENYRGFVRINRILIQRPFLTVLVLMLFVWTIFVPYTPLVLNLIIYLSVLIILFLILRPIIDPFIKETEIGVIILLTLSNLQMFAWYFGAYSRFYLVFESVAGIFLTYKYILPWFRNLESTQKNSRIVFVSRIFTIIILIFYSVAFFANIAGFLNLATYCLKLGVYTGVISFIVHGLNTIISNVFLAGIEVLNIYYPDIVIKYGKSIVTKFNRFLKFFLGILWIVGMLRIAELYELLKTKIILFLTDSAQIGSLSFTLGNMLLFLFILYFTYVIASLTKRIFEREILAKYNMKRGMAASISLTIRILLVFLGTLIALSVSGMDLGKIGIIAGALSVGIGFGLQNIVSNFISGLILVYEKPVQEGDTVEVDTLLGRVSNIGIRSSTITTYDGAEVVVPNSNLISNQLINWTLSDNKKRIEIRVGAAYGSNPHEILQLLLKAALSHEKVLRYPEPRPLFIGFGSNSLDFRLLFWVPFEDGILTQSEVAIKVYDIFKENNIVIPFPQLDLHIKKPSDKQSKKDDN